MQVTLKKLAEIRPYEKNAKKHDSRQIKNVAESIKQYGFVQPVVVDKNNVIVIGHCRALAAKKLGIKEVPCVCVDDLTPEQVNALRLVDNKSNESDWDFDLLAEELPELDLSAFDFDWDIPDETIGKYDTDRNDKNLQERFGIPPFSIFDTRQKYWQDRKREWLSIGITSENGRVDNLLSDGLNVLSEDKGANTTGTSVFDPVLCEIVYKWFCVENGAIFDPFAGGSVRGIVASKLGFSYTGIDLRDEQITENKKNAEAIGADAVWFCDDSLNQDKYVKDKSIDMVFSCPPYADLEVYSDDQRDISNMGYDDFLQAYRTIIKKACGKLKENRFAVWVVGDVRDKKGLYRDFVGDTKQAFFDAGLKLYNDIVLLNATGTAALRAGKQFQAGRKVVKLHQNVLVFYKGDPAKIKVDFGPVETMDNAEFE